MLDPIPRHEDLCHHELADAHQDVVVVGQKGERLQLILIHIHQEGRSNTPGKLSKDSLLFEHPLVWVHRLKEALQFPTSGEKFIRKVSHFLTSLKSFKKFRTGEVLGLTVETPCRRRPP